MINPGYKNGRLQFNWECCQFILRALLLLGFALGSQNVLQASPSLLNNINATSTSLNVTNFGARGDAVQILVTTISNSSVVTFPATNPLASTDVGKVILLFGVGPATTPTNNQDLIASIVSVSNGTNVILSGTINRARADDLAGHYAMNGFASVQKTGRLESQPIAANTCLE